MWTMQWDLFVMDTFHRCNDLWFILMSDMFPTPIYVVGDNDNDAKRRDDHRR